MKEDWIINNNYLWIGLFLGYLGWVLASGFTGWVKWTLLIFNPMTIRTIIILWLRKEFLKDTYYFALNSFSLMKQEKKNKKEVLKNGNKKKI